MSDASVLYPKIHALLEKAWADLGQTQETDLVKPADGGRGEGLWETSIGIEFVEDAVRKTIPVDFEVQTLDYPEQAPHYLVSLWWLFDVPEMTQDALDALDSFNSEPGIKLRFEMLEKPPVALVLQAELALSLLERAPEAFAAVLQETLERLFAFVEEHYATLKGELKGMD